MSSLDPQALYDKYKDDLSPFIDLLEKRVGSTIFSFTDVSKIITYFSIVLVPKMMSDVGKIQSLAGSDKKDLIVKTIKFILTQVFLELDETSGDVPKLLEEAILIAVDPTIEVLIQVENDKLVFNPKTASRLKKLRELCHCK